MTTFDFTETNKARARRGRLHARFAKYVREGRDYVTLVAHQSFSSNRAPSDNPPFVQFAWRDDLRLQVEVQGDHYRDEPYSAPQQRMLTRLGYAPPFEHGDDFGNWTLFREAEGCHPESVATLLLESMWLVHGVHWHDFRTAERNKLAHWQFEWSVSPGKRDIEAEIQARFNLN